MLAMARCYSLHLLLLLSLASSSFNFLARGSRAPPRQTFFKSRLSKLLDTEDTLYRILHRLPGDEIRNDLASSFARGTTNCVNDCNRTESTMTERDKVVVNHSWLPFTKQRSKPIDKYRTGLELELDDGDTLSQELPELLPEHVYIDESVRSKKLMYGSRDNGGSHKMDVTGQAGYSLSTEYTDQQGGRTIEFRWLNNPEDVHSDEQTPILKSLVYSEEPDDHSSTTEKDNPDSKPWPHTRQNSPWLHQDSVYRDRGEPSSGIEHDQGLEQVRPQRKTTGQGPAGERPSGPAIKRDFADGHIDRLRVFLPQMRKFPFSNIARLSTGCTGTLVTPRHVLTAAHCMHDGLDFLDNLEKLKIEIPDNMGFKDYYAQKITVPTGWLRDNSTQERGARSGKRAVYDYAVVHLTLAVAGRTRFLPLAVPRSEVLQMDFHFLAFPQDGQQLWRSVCQASQHMALWDGNLIMTRCDSAVGNSGAAVFVQDPAWHHGGPRVVGVLSNTVQVGLHRSYLRRYSIITALTWPKLAHICRELQRLGQLYGVCPPNSYYMRRSPTPRLHQMDLKVVPFFGKRGGGGGGGGRGGGEGGGEGRGRADVAVAVEGRMGGGGGGGEGDGPGSWRSSLGVVVKEEEGE